MKITRQQHPLLKLFKRHLKSIILISSTILLLNIFLRNHRILVSIKINYPTFLLNNPSDLPSEIRKDTTTTSSTSTSSSNTPSSISDATNNNNEQAIHVASTLSNPDLFFTKISELYKKYGNEIATFRPQMRKYCEEVQNCKFCDYEAEMLYMLIREYKPQRVFELVSPGMLGYTSHWILHALHENDNTSKLHSFGIHPNVRKHIGNSKYKSRFKGTQGDYGKQFDAGLIVMDQYDFILIDASTNPSFVEGYCKRLLGPHKRKALVAVHDIVSNNMSTGGPSILFRHILENKRIHNIFTVSSKFMPNIAQPIDGAVTKLNLIRAEAGIVKPCSDPSSCDDPSHDHLYITQNDSPTLFFELN